jgi:hypothetical protein
MFEELKGLFEGCSYLGYLQSCSYFVRNAIDCNQDVTVTTVVADDDPWSLAVASIVCDTEISSESTRSQRSHRSELYADCLSRRFLQQQSLPLPDHSIS